VDAQRKAIEARLIQKVYEVDPLACPNGGATMRIITLIDDINVVERILKHLKVWDLVSDRLKSSSPDPPSATAPGVALPPASLPSWPDGETLPLTYHPIPDIA